MLFAPLLADRLILPERLEFSGSPILDSPNPYRIQTHGVTITIDPSGTATVSSTTVYRNQGGAVSAKLTLQRWGAKGHIPTFAIKATWDNHPVVFSEKAQPDSDFEVTNLTATVPMGNQATHALRVSYAAAMSRTGYDNKKLTAWYRLDPGHAVDLFTISFKYPEKMVFGLPDMAPDLGWEVGAKGASARKTNFDAKGAVASATFYFNSLENGQGK